MDSAVAPSHQVLLYYLYVAIPDAAGYVERHRRLCADLGLRGRILVGDEGINGTVSGETPATEAYMEALRSDPLTARIAFKTDPSDGHVFPKLSVKLRAEIVTLGLPPEEDVDPEKLTGERLSPVAFLAAMQEPDAVLLDGRNDYESALGRFKGAICPPVGHFRDFPAWIREHGEELRGKRILTYCTGGIRCEKLSGYLKDQGFERVYQLDGGIVSYGKDPEARGRDFEGLCYVFDERVGIEVNRTETRRVISHCRHCGTEEARYGNCLLPECNARIFVCPACRESFGLYCGEGCRPPR